MNKYESVPILGSIVAVASGLRLEEWASIFGILFGFCTLLIHLYYKQKEFRLKEMELELKYRDDKNKQD